MKIKIAKIIILIIPLFILIGGFCHICYAQQQLLLNYPSISGETLTPKTPLPNLIKYIYMFALGIVGVVALLSMLIGAVKYVLSAGNPSKASDAKDQIFSAILGIILLLASVMILRTINPDLVNIGFKLPDIQGGGGERTQWYCYACCNQSPATCNLSGPLTGCKPLGIMTANEAANTCENMAKKECYWASWGYNSQARTTPCP